MIDPAGPSLERFRSMARLHRIVPVWRELVADTFTPVAAFLQIVGTEDTSGFLLESVEGGERWGRYSFIGRNPLATIVTNGTEVTTRGDLDLDALRVRERALRGLHDAERRNFSC